MAKRQLWAALLAAWGLFMFTGCSGMPQVVFARDQADALASALEQRIQTLESTLQIIPSDDPERPGVEAMLADTRRWAGEVRQAVAFADQVIAESKTPSGPISSAVGAIAPWIPEPARTPLVLGAALVTTLLRHRQVRAASASIIASIDHALQDDEAFAKQFKGHADTLRSIQTPLARRMVDEVQARRTKAAA